MNKRRKAIAPWGVAIVLLLWLASPCWAEEPQSAEKYFTRGRARYTAGDFDGAIEDFTSAIILNSSLDARAHKQVKKDRVINDSFDLSEKIAIVDKFNAAAYLFRGTARLNKGDLNGAIRDLDKAVALNPQDSWAFNYRACARQRMGDIDGAVGDLNRAIQLDPRSSSAYNNRGILLFKRKDFAGAVADYTHAIEIDPQNASAYNNRGNAYEAQGELERAREDFDRAIEVDASLLIAYMNRGVTLILQGKDAEAAKDFAHYLRYAGDKKDILDRLVREARDSRPVSVVH